MGNGEQAMGNGERKFPLLPDDVGAKNFSPSRVAGD